MTSARESALKARIAQLLALDPLKQVVSGVTLTVLAREFSAAAAIEDSDVLAERAACVAVMVAALARLGAIETIEQGSTTTVCAEAFALELRRLQYAIEAVRQGLHRE